jgi:hypothetical protein
MSRRLRGGVLVLLLTGTCACASPGRPGDGAQISAIGSGDVIGPTSDLHLGRRSVTEVRLQWTPAYGLAGQVRVARSGSIECEKGRPGSRVHIALQRDPVRTDEILDTCARVDLGVPQDSFPTCANVHDLLVRLPDGRFVRLEASHFDVPSDPARELVVRWLHELHRQAFPDPAAHQGSSR